MWVLLGSIVALQMYVVREMLVVMALFAVGFAAIAFVLTSLYMLQKGWELAVIRVADSQHPAVNLARQSVNAIEDLGRRPFRGTGSAAAR